MYTFNKNTFFTKPKRDHRDLIELEIGDSKQDKFLPQMKTARWGNEVNLSVRLKHNETDPVITKEGNQIIWTGGKVQSRFYTLDSGEGATEFEVVLLEKPLSNVVEFSLNTKGLRFSYQGDLTFEEQVMGATRPENVIGSYAVYAAEDRINLEGGIEYKSGKIGHIYRPKIVDSGGREVWGILHVDAENDKLTVTIPEDFLDEAVYPVYHAAGLTMGYSSAGASYFNQQNNYIILLSYGTPSVNGKVSKISYYGGLDGGSTGFKGTIYKVSDKVLIQAGGATTLTTSIGWWDSTFSSQPSVTNGTQYYLGAAMEANFGGGFRAYYDTDFGGTSAGYGDFGTDQYTTPGNLVTTAGPTYNFSVYATYTADASPSTFLMFF